VSASQCCLLTLSRGLCDITASLYECHFSRILFHLTPIDEGDLLKISVPGSV